MTHPFDTGRNKLKKNSGWMGFSRALIFITVAGLTSVSGAQVLLADPGHADENFPEGALLILEGEDVISKTECHLFIMDAGYTGPEKTPDQFRAKILTGYTHDGEQAEMIELRVSEKDPLVLTGLGANGKDQIAVFLSAPGEDLTSATAYNAKWWHTNHFHNNRCVNLKVHAH